MTNEWNEDTCERRLVKIIGRHHACNVLNMDLSVPGSMVTSFEDVPLWRRYFRRLDNSKARHRADSMTKKVAIAVGLVVGAFALSLVAPSIQLTPINTL